MNNIAHRRNQLKSRNTCTQRYEIYNKIIRGRKNPLFFFFLRIQWSLFIKHWVPFTQGCFAPRLVENCPVVLNRKIFKLGKSISTIMLLSPLGKVHCPLLKSPSPKNALWKFGWNWFCKRRFVMFQHCIFIISLLSSFGKDHGPLFEQTLIHTTQGSFVQSFVEICLVVLQKKDF